MKCINCGAEIPSTDKFCSYCGSELPSPPPSPVTNNTTTHSSDSHNVTIINHNYGPYRAATEQDLVHPTYSPKKLSITRLLTYFTGYFGFHQFYIGNIRKGILYLFTAGLFLFGWIIDSIKVTKKTLVDKNGLRIVK